MKIHTVKKKDTLNPKHHDDILIHHKVVPQFVS